MGFTNMAEPAINRRDARRHRAAVRLQTSGPLFHVWNTAAQARLETRLTEFVGLCRNGAVSYGNVYDVAVNILAPVAKVMGDKNHQHWLARFNEEGVRATSISNRS